MLIIWLALNTLNAFKYDGYPVCFRLLANRLVLAVNILSFYEYDSQILLEILLAHVAG